MPTALIQLKTDKGLSSVHKNRNMEAGRGLGIFRRLNEHQPLLRDPIADCLSNLKGL